MFQWIKHVPPRHEYLSSDPRTYIKLDMVEWDCCPSTHTARQDTETGEPLKLTGQII